VQDLRDTVVREHGEALDVSAEWAGEERVGGGRGWGVDCGPGLGDEDRGRFQRYTAGGCFVVIFWGWDGGARTSAAFVPRLVAERRERFGDHYYEV
jgi:hypothetical protein